MFVATGAQAGRERSEHSSTTTVIPAAQSMVKPNWLVRTPKPGPLAAICGSHGEVGSPPKVLLQPVVPGK